MRTQRWMTCIAVAALTAAVSAHAGPIEDKFRNFLDGLKKTGQGVSAAAVTKAMGAPEAKTTSVVDRKDALPLGQEQAVVFVANGCVSCNGLAEKLRSTGVGTVEVMNISTNATAREAFASSGAQAVPATLIGKRLVTGADIKAIERARIEDLQQKTQQQQGQGA